jgi:predicted methyltransferase
MFRTSVFATGTLLLIGALTAVATARGVAVPPYILAAVADKSRPEADTQRDADRKPAETLAFAGIKPGEQVAELIPGAGYFTRLLSDVVGPKGKVYALANPKSPTAPADAPEPAARLAPITSDPHYANVAVSTLSVRVAPIALPQDVDVVWTSQNYHDFHNVKELNVVDLDKAVFNALKPGGIYIVLDHAAEAGSGFRDTSTLHRIDEDAVKQEVESAGFKFVGESGVLRNKADAHTEKVFDGAIRGHTDQFILKFQKPK